MGLIERVRKSRDEERVIDGTVVNRNWSVPFMPWASWETGGTFGQGGPNHPSRHNAYGNTTENALALPAIHAGAKILASNTACLPIKLYQGNSDGTRSPYAGPSLFDKPNHAVTTPVFISELMLSLVVRGNAWAFVTGKDAYGFPTGLEFIPDEDVNVQPDEAFPRIASKAHVFVNGNELKWYGPNRDIVHFKVLSLPGQLRGPSLVQNLAGMIRSGRLAAEYGDTFFENGGQPPGLFQNKEVEVNRTQAAEIRRQLTDTIRSGQALVIGSDWDYSPVKISAEEAQFLKTMQVNANMVAGVLGLPPEMIGGTTAGHEAYSSPAMNQTAILEAIRPYLAVLEATFNELLPARRTMQFWERAIYRLDPKSLAELAQIERDAGFNTADEYREDTGRAPLPNGVGDEALPNTVLVSMARGAKAIPKSWKSAVDVHEAPTPVQPLPSAAHPNQEGHAA